MTECAVYCFVARKYVLLPHLHRQFISTENGVTLWLFTCFYQSFFLGGGVYVPHLHTQFISTENGVIFVALYMLLPVFFLCACVLLCVKSIYLVTLLVVRLLNLLNLNSGVLFLAGYATVAVGSHICNQLT